MRSSGQTTWDIENEQFEDEQYEDRIPGSNLHIFVPGMYAAFLRISKRGRGLWDVMAGEVRDHADKHPGNCQQSLELGLCPKGIQAS
jgi:hypothetical protein